MRFEHACGDLRDRLIRVCRHVPKEELEQLVARMTRLKLRYEQWTGMPATHGESLQRAGGSNPELRI